MYSMLDNNNPVVQQTIQHDKENYIANNVVNSLLVENCSQNEYRNILKIVEQRLLGKSVYEELEYDK